MRVKVRKHTYKGKNLQLCVKNSFKHKANMHASSICDVTTQQPAHAATHRLLLSLYHTVNSTVLGNEIKKTYFKMTIY